MNIIRMKFFGKVACLALLLFGALPGVAAAQDINKIWTAAASTGVPDEASQGQVIFTESLATIGPTPQPATVLLRYNVTAVDGLFAAPLTPTSWPTLIVRYRDNHSSQAQVIVELKEHILAGPQAGQTNTLITFDSNEFPQQPGYQTQSIGNCGHFTGFQFLQPQAARVYFIEARLIRTGSAYLANPGLAGLAITRYGVCQGFGFTQQ